MLSHHLKAFGGKIMLKGWIIQINILVYGA